jgi:hypothetical protein
MQLIWLMISLGIGAILCVVLGCLIVAHWRLPWKQTLMYFGLMPYPNEARPKPRRRQAPRPTRATARRRPATAAGRRPARPARREAVRG